MRRLTCLCDAGQDLCDQRIACATKLEDYLANTPKHEQEVKMLFDQDLNSGTCPHLFKGLHLAASIIFLFLSTIGSATLGAKNYICHFLLTF